MAEPDNTAISFSKVFLYHKVPPERGGDILFNSVTDQERQEMSISQLLTSEQWCEYLQELSKTIKCEISILNNVGTRLFVANENPYCKYIKSVQSTALNCPDSCNKAVEITDLEVFKCDARVINFAFPVERFGEKIVVVGRTGFAVYEDFIYFLKVAKENGLFDIPVSSTLEFPEEDYLKAVGRYVYITLTRMLNSFEEKYRLEEKIFRMTALFDRQTFETLSKSPELIYRYVLDTIEFVFGPTSSILMLIDEDNRRYNTVYTTGKFKDSVMDFSLDKGSPLINEMRNTRSGVFYDSLEKITTVDSLRSVKSSYFFPLFVENDIQVVIGIFDKKLSQEDIKIMDAFRDYAQLNLENHNLRVEVDKNRKADKKLAGLIELSNSIVSILDKQKLLNTLLEKSLQLLNAEQGSLMLLDRETSELVVEAKKSIDDTVQEKMRFKKNEGISGLVLESGGALLVEDIEQDPRIRQANRPRYRTKSFISVPIKVEDRLTGVLNVSDKIEGDVFNEDDLRLVESFINNVAIAIERSILYKQTEDLQKLSITDPLTGIYNRRYLNRRLSEEITKYNRYRHPFSFMMLDLDRFKEYNDTYGHISGDNLLKALASIMEKSLRTIDIAARFGGDEFVAIFPQTPKVDAIQITNRLKEKIDKALSEYSAEVPLTISIGLATYPDDASSIMELIEKTDQALYLAKKGGGNRVVYL
jgi:diguanylate cyclase (GGDEF)-like protein